MKMFLVAGALASTAVMLAGTPQVVPEPSTYMIVGGALAAGAWLHARRNNKKK